MRGERGQAAVETLGVLGALFVLALLSLQVVVWAASAVELSRATQAATRAAARGDDPGAAARAALPGVLRGGLRVAPDGARLRVSLAPPRLAPFLPVLRLSDASVREAAR